MRVLSFPESTVLIGQLRGVASRLVKRVIDIVFSILALLFLSPLIGLIAIAIKRDSPGPVFYGGTRIGRGGKTFKIWKFRTMYEAPQSYQGPRVTAQDDPRITPLGHWLRNTKLNELPQFWNVLVGEMSLVGPRPEDPTVAKNWPEAVANEILSVRPGITSPTSVLYRNEEKLLSQGMVMQKYIQELSPDKNRLDQIYVRHHGLWLDLDTLLWTFLLLLPKVGAFNPPESLLFFGPVTRFVRRYLNWFTIDGIITLGALGFSGVVWRFSGPLNLGWAHAIAVGIAFSLLYSIVAALLGVNRIAWSKANFSDALDLIPAWFLSTSAAVTINHSGHLLPNELIITASLMALGGYIFMRYRTRLLAVIFSWFSRSLPGIHTSGERVLIVGSGTTAQQAEWLLSHPDNSNKFWVVGFVDNDYFKQGTRIYGSYVLGSCKQMPDLIKKYDIGLVIITDYKAIGKDYHVVSQACRNTAVRYVVFPNLQGIFHGLATMQLAIPVTAQGINSAEQNSPMNHCESADKEDLHPDENDPCLHCLAQYIDQHALGTEK